MTFLIASKEGLLTGRSLADALGIPFYGPRKLARAIRRHRLPVQPHIRWGSGVAVDGPEVNDVHAVLRASDKLRSIQTWTKNCIPTLEIVTAPPAFGRKRHHTKGRDIIICRTEEEMAAAGNRVDYFTGLCYNESEFRVHIFGDAVIRVQLKVPREEGANQEIKNTDNGWGYRNVTPKNLENRLYTIARAAVSALGLTFGAADILYDGKEFRVLEVNTAPSLNDVGMECYLAPFREWMDEVG